LEQHTRDVGFSFFCGRQVFSSRKSKKFFFLSMGSDTQETGGGRNGSVDWLWGMGLNYKTDGYA